MGGMRRINYNVLLTFFSRFTNDLAVKLQWYSTPGAYYIAIRVQASDLYSEPETRI